MRTLHPAYCCVGSGRIVVWMLLVQKCQDWSRHGAFLCKLGVWGGPGDTDYPKLDIYWPSPGLGWLVVLILDKLLVA